MRCVRRMFGRKGHCFDEECQEKRRQTRVALKKFKEKDDISRTEYWAKRKAYERMVGKKRCIWQEKETEYINKLICEKEIKKNMESSKEDCERKGAHSLCRTK
jgi:hypothetical protein